MVSEVENIATKGRQEEIIFDAEKEEFNLYNLSDGNILKIKVVVTRVVKYPDQLDDLGMPNYSIKSHNAVMVIPPEGIKRV